MTDTIDSFSNNCTLVAARELTGLPDETILRVWREHGYQDHGGMWDRDWVPALRDLGLRLVQKSTWRLNNRRAPHPTLAQFVSDHPEGVWIAGTSSHVMVVRDGRIVDPNYRRPGTRRLIRRAWLVLNAAPPRRGSRLVVASNPKRGASRFRLRTAQVYLDAHPDATLEQVYECTHYEPRDYRHDLRRGIVRWVD